MSEEDNRGWLTHKVHQWGHELNSKLKSEGKSGIETWGIYRSYSPKKAAKGEWSKDVDDRRAEYHRKKADEQGCILL